MAEGFDIKEEARKHFTKHYPLASQQEIEKQIEDWVRKVESGAALVDFFSERVGSIAGKKILDVGFGSGGIAIAFNKAGAEMHGVDVETELLPIAERNIAAHQAQADLKIYNGRTLPFADGSFDYVTSFSVLEHVSDPYRVINEIMRVLKPDGRLLLTLPNKYAPKETHTLVYFVSYMPRFLAELYLRILKRSPLKDDNLHFYSYFDVLRMFKKSYYKYELVYKDLSAAWGWKRFLAALLKISGMHYTAFLRQLIFIVEKK